MPVAGFADFRDDASLLTHSSGHIERLFARAFTKSFKCQALLLLVSEVKKAVAGYGTGCLERVGVYFLFELRCLEVTGELGSLVNTN